MHPEPQPTEDTSSTNLSKHLVGVPRWPAFIALIAVGGIYLLVSDRLTAGPSWLLLLIVLVMLAPITFGHKRGYKRMVHVLVLSLIGLATLVVAISAFFLVTQLTQSGQRLAGTQLLQDAALIWVANVLIFAVWYWDIDGGGPAQRRRDHHTSTDFLFPQMTIDHDHDSTPPWSPDFIDYLFLAFNTSTAFSPTDTLVLSRQAKLLMMAQSLISLIVIAVLAARAVNTFQ